MTPAPLWNPSRPIGAAILIYGTAVAIFAALAGCATPTPDGARVDPACVVWWSRWEPDVYIAPEKRARCPQGLTFREIPKEYNP